MKTIQKLIFTMAITTLLFASCNSTKSTRIKLDNGEFVEFSKDKGYLSFKDWDSFNSVNQEMHTNKNADIQSKTNRLEGLKVNIGNLQNTIPYWLKTEEVLEDIDDVQEEFKKLIKEKNEPTKNVEQNLEEFTEKFDDLREELNETINNQKL